MDISMVCVVLGFCATLVCVSLMRPIAIHWGLVDRPGGRKQHRGEVPLIGGAALFAVVAGSWAILRIDWPTWMPAYLLAAGTLVVVARRIIHGVNPMRADRSHVHHCLLSLGVSERWVVASIWLCQAVLTIVGLSSWWVRYSEAMLFYSFTLLFLAYSLVLEWAYRTGVRRVASIELQANRTRTG